MSHVQYNFHALLLFFFISKLSYFVTFIDKHVLLLFICSRRCSRSPILGIPTWHKRRASMHDALQFRLWAARTLRGPNEGANLPRGARIQSRVPDIRASENLHFHWPIGLLAVPVHVDLYATASLISSCIYLQSKALIFYSKLKLNPEGRDLADWMCH